MALEEGRFFVGSMTDKRFEADPFAEYCRKFLSPGVWALDTNLQVTPGGGMTVIINYGEALVDGYPYRVRDNGTGQLQLTLEDADASNPRIDRILVRKDPATLRIRAYIMPGTPAAVPEAPEPERTNDVYEISLARIVIDAGATEIVEGDITDERDESAICGNPLRGIITAVKNELYYNIIYAIGKPYISFTDSRNPHDILGFGTWAAVEGMTLVGYQEGDTDFGTIGAMIGEKTHTLTTGEFPPHSHDNILGNGSGSVTTAQIAPNLAPFGTGQASAETGGGGAHNNIQPSIIVYIWVRTA